MVQIFSLFFSLGWICCQAQGTRIKDISSIRGVRSNQLIGYGLVVGLKATGDKKLEFTSQSMKRMLDKLGVKLGEGIPSSSNVAAVVVTASLPPFARAGNPLGVQVNSIGDAKSLKGGTLVQTPLRAADQQVYAVAQGPLLVDSRGKKGHPTVAYIPDGALVERDFIGSLKDRKMFRLILHRPDFTTAARVAKTVNLDLAGQYARAVDPATIDLVVPFSYRGKVIEFLASIEGLEIHTDSTARVLVNAKTGTVIIGHRVRVKEVAISHGDLTVKVQGPKAGERKLASSGGQKAKGKKEGESLALVPQRNSVGELVKALNRLGVSPKDLISILQNLKAAGALEAELEVL